MLPMAITNSGAVSARLIQNRRVMSRSSGLSSSRAMTRGSRAIPQIGQLPGPSRTISRMHWTGVLSPGCGEHGRFGIERHSTLRARSRAALPHLGTHRADVSRVCLACEPTTHEPAPRPAHSFSVHPPEHPETQVPIPSASGARPESFRDSPETSRGNRRSRSSIPCRRTALCGMAVAAIHVHPAYRILRLRLGRRRSGVRGVHGIDLVHLWLSEDYVQKSIEKVPGVQYDRRKPSNCARPGRWRCRTRFAESAPY